MTRRHFFELVPTAAAVCLVRPGAAQGAYSQTDTAQTLYPEFPSHDPKKVMEAVGAAHANLPRLKELVEAQPELAKATWDWGFGDWESALGAASHVGRRDIAEFLMKQGARPDIFTFAMLGSLEAVKGMVEANPGVQRIPGPHGLTLLHHARAGGAESAPVAKYLEALGGADEKPVDLPISAAEVDRYLGLYSFGPGKEDALEVTKSSQGILSIKRIGRSLRFLNRVGEHVFAPRGAPSVRIRFAVEGDKATTLTVLDPGPVVVCRRVDQA